MPTTRPRYTVTDTGDVRRMLDLAEQRWPDVENRRELLLRLAALGADVIGPERDKLERRRLRALQLAALSRAGELVDTDVLLSETAWR